MQREDIAQSELITSWSSADTSNAREMQRHIIQCIMLKTSVKLSFRHERMYMYVDVADLNSGFGKSIEKKEVNVDNYILKFRGHNSHTCPAHDVIIRLRSHGWYANCKNKI